MIPTEKLSDPYHESEQDSLRSMLAQMKFQLAVKRYKEKGVNFVEHLYVPEVDATTGQHFLSREDHNNVLKVSKSRVSAAHVNVIFFSISIQPIIHEQGHQQREWNVSTRQ